MIYNILQICTKKVKIPNGNLIGIMSSTNHEQGVSLGIAIEQINIFLKDINTANK